MFPYESGYWPPRLVGAYYLPHSPFVDPEGCANMANRTRLNPDGASCLRQVLNAVRSGADSQLIALRARRLLAHMPPQLTDRQAWLSNLIREKTCYERVLTALQATSASQKQAAAAEVADLAGASEAPTTGRPGRRRSRGR